MKKKNIGLAITGIFLLLALIIVMNCFFVVNEYESAIIKRFGSIEGVYVKNGAEEVHAAMVAYNPAFASVAVHNGTGFKFKIPFIDNVVKYNNRLLTYDTSPREVITLDKKKLVFDNNAQWKIKNPLLFDITMGNIASAETRIDDILYSSMREKVGKITATRIISDKELGKTLLSELTLEVNLLLQSYGVEVCDIKIKRTDVPDENHQSIYNNMITERNRMAAQYRSEGEEQAIKTRSDTDRMVAIIISEAKSRSEIIKGEGDAEAARIYSEAYGANPEFYTFYNTLTTYRETLGKNVTLVLPASSEFAKYLTGNN